MNEHPKQLPSLMTREVAGELMVYDTEGRRMHVLNGSARYVWEACTGAQSAADIAAAVVAEYGIDADRALADVTACLSSFAERGMLA